MSKIVLLVALLLSQLSLASREIELVKFTNDIDESKSATMFLVVDENMDILNFGKKEFNHGLLIQRKTFPSFIGYGGLVFKRMKDRDILIFKGLNVTPQNGGAIEVDFLYNAISRERAGFLVELDRTSDSWQLTSQGKIIKTLHVISHKKPFVGIVGIKRIELKNK